jgi:thiol-disulfide isomerase/thioredoxin
MPYLDVTSPTQVPEFMKRILKGPITFVVIYADWCGHCHEYKPKFEEAANNANRNAQAVAVNETALPAVQSALNKHNNNATSMEIDGYPSVVKISPNGNSTTVPERNDALTAMLNKAANKSSPTLLTNQEAAIPHMTNNTPAPVQKSINESVLSTPEQPIKTHYIPKEIIGGSLYKTMSDRVDKSITPFFTVNSYIDSMHKRHKKTKKSRRK